MVSSVNPMQGSHVLQGQVTVGGLHTRIGTLMCRALGLPAATTQGSQSSKSNTETQMSEEDADQNESDAGQL
jgi:hypothetical protein